MSEVFLLLWIRNVSHHDPSSHLAERLRGGGKRVVTFVVDSGSKYTSTDLMHGGREESSPVYFPGKS